MHITLVALRPIDRPNRRLVDECVDLLKSSAKEMANANYYKSVYCDRLYGCFSVQRREIFIIIMSASTSSRFKVTKRCIFYCEYTPM